VSGLDAVRNLGSKAGRRLQAVHKPFVRMMRRRAREGEHEALRRDALAVDREIARLALGTAPIIAGPWLAEVGYEVLYWIPFLRWFREAHAVPRGRLIIVSRGGMEAVYADVGGTYVDIFDLATPESLAAGNARRRAEHEGGGQKQSVAGAFDEELLAATRARLGLPRAPVLHPSLLFRLFRNVWHGNLPMDFFWRRTQYAMLALEKVQAYSGVPDDFIAVKLYSGAALPRNQASQEAVRSLVTRIASIAPVVALDTDLGVDEHSDFDLHGIPGVTSVRELMSPRTNLGVQLALIARSRLFLGTCGGLAWMAPFLGVPTVAVYENDRILAPHLLIARQAGALVGAAEFATVDLRALGRLGVLDAPGRMGSDLDSCAIRARIKI